MATLQQRIAALQQRSAAPQPPPSTAHPPAPSSLRDKIARFDKKGGLPVPARRAADLYANRAPRPSGGDSTLASEQTNTPLLQSEVNERTLTATEANEQTLLQSTALSKLQSEANEQTLLQSTANTPLLQSMANTTLLHSTANTPLLQSTANTLLHSKTNTPSSQSAAHERQSAPILAVNDQDQTPSSPTTPHAPTFNLSSALGQHSPAATSPERVPPIATDDDQQTLAQDEPKSVSSNFTATIQFSEPSSSPLTKTSTDDDQRTLTQETQISRDEPKSSFRAAIHHQTVPPSPPLTKTSIDDDQQTLAQDEPKSVSSNFRATIHHKVSEPPSSLLTKTSDHGKAIDDDQQTLAQETRISRDEPKSSFKATIHHKVSEPPSPPLTKSSTDDDQQTLSPETQTCDEPKSSFKATIHHQVSEPPSPPLTKSSTNDDQQTLAQDEPKLRSSFRATIHHKAPEPSLSPQSTTPIRRVASAVPLGSGTTLDQKPGAFPSLVFGDLADLLQSTVLLQERLDNSPVSPSETTIANSGVPVIVTDEDHDDTDLQSPDTNLEVRRLSKEEVEENKRTLWKLQAKREEQARSKVRNGFFGPFGRASKDVSRETLKGMSIDGAAVPSQQQQLYSKRSKSPSILNTAKDIKSSLDAPGEDNLHPKTLENQSTGSPSGKTSGLSPKSPPKSPKSGLSAFRLLASRSSPSSAQDCRHGSHGRNSVSTSSEFSSEDSALSVVTPPDDVNEFGGLRSWLSMGSSQSKKGGDVEERDRHISRAVSFKFWQRARTRSGASTRSVQSLRGRWSHDPPPTLPPLPDNLMASDGQAGEDMLGPLPTRKTPLLPRSPNSSLPPRKSDMSPLSFDLDPSRSPTHKGLQAYRAHSPGAHSILSESPPSLSAAYRSRSDLGSTPSSPGQTSAKRRSCTSSSHYANSSVLDIDLFDAFPSVPENGPLVFHPPLPCVGQRHASTLLRSGSAVSLTSSMLTGPLPASLLSRERALLSPAVDLTGSCESAKASAYLLPKSDME